MKCPIDGSDLVMTERQGIEIDYCPKCRGVWLDRGELDKIIDRSSSASPEPSFAPSRRDEPTQPHPQPGYDHRAAQYDERHERDRRYQNDPRHPHDQRHRKRRSGFLGELFDFD